MGNNSSLEVIQNNFKEQHFNIGYESNSNIYNKSRISKITKGIWGCVVGASLTFSGSTFNNSITNIDSMVAKKVFIEMPAETKKESFDYRVNFIPIYSYNGLSSNYKGDKSMKFDNSLIDNLTKTSKKKKTLFIDDEVLNEEVISRRVPHVRVGTVAIKTKGKKISTFHMEG